MKIFKQKCKHNYKLIEKVTFNNFKFAEYKINLVIFFLECEKCKNRKYETIGGVPADISRILENWKDNEYDISEVLKMFTLLDRYSEVNNV